MLSDTKLQIGPSLGWLCAIGIYDTESQEAFIEKTEADIAEICMGNWETYAQRIPALSNKRAFIDTSYLSLHFPDIDNTDIGKRVQEVRCLVNTHSVDMVLTHPQKKAGVYPLSAYEEMILAGVPLAVENMDAQKDSGYLLSDLEQITSDTQIYFVLDVQHAYEHDPTMIYAMDLFEMFRGRLSHLHVSGEMEGNNHCLVHRANNASRIIECLGCVLSDVQVPIIIEGQYSTPEELQEEIKFIKLELGITI